MFIIVFFYLFIRINGGRYDGWYLLVSIISNHLQLYEFCLE